MGILNKKGKLPQSIDCGSFPFCNVYANIKLQEKIKKFLIFLGNGKIKYTFLLKKRVHDLLLYLFL